MERYYVDNLVNSQELLQKIQSRWLWKVTHMKKFIGIVGIGFICCLIFVILWTGKNPES